MSKVSAHKMIHRRLYGTIYQGNGGLYEAAILGQDSGQGPNIEFICKVIDELLQPGASDVQ